jgi:hypothetical protein
MLFLKLLIRHVQLRSSVWYSQSTNSIHKFTRLIFERLKALSKDNISRRLGDLWSASNWSTLKSTALNTNLTSTYLKRFTLFSTTLLLFLTFCDYLLGFNILISFIQEFYWLMKTLLRSMTFKFSLVVYGLKYVLTTQQGREELRNFIVSNGLITIKGWELLDLFLPPAVSTKNTDTLVVEEGEVMSSSPSAPLSQFDYISVYKRALLPRTTQLTQQFPQSSSTLGLRSRSANVDILHNLPTTGSYPATSLGCITRVWAPELRYLDKFSKSMDLSSPFRSDLEFSVYLSLSRLFSESNSEVVSHFNRQQALMCRFAAAREARWISRGNALGRTGPHLFLNHQTSLLNLAPNSGMPNPSTSNVWSDSLTRAQTWWKPVSGSSSAGWTRYGYALNPTGEPADLKDFGATWYLPVGYNGVSFFGLDTMPTTLPTNVGTFTASNLVLYTKLVSCAQRLTPLGLPYIHDGAVAVVNDPTSLFTRRPNTSTLESHHILTYTLAQSKERVELFLPPHRPQLVSILTPSLLSNTASSPRRYTLLRK